MPEQPDHQKVLAEAVAWLRDQRLTLDIRSAFITEERAQNAHIDTLLSTIDKLGAENERLEAETQEAHDRFADSEASADSWLAEHKMSSARAEAAEASRDQLATEVEWLKNGPKPFNIETASQIVAALHQRAEAAEAKLGAVSAERDIALNLHQDALRLAGVDVTEAYEIGRGLRPSPFESGWLIEAWDSKTSEHKAKWFNLVGFLDGVGDEWTSVSSIALRFARKCDAQAYIEETGWTEAKPTEHGWGKPVSTSRSALSEQAAAQEGEDRRFRYGKWQGALNTTAEGRCPACGRDPFDEDGPCCAAMWPGEPTPRTWVVPQHRVRAWMAECFGEEVAADITERGDRLLEEVYELLQAIGYDKLRVFAVARYVWDRTQGAAAQEVGGVGLTLTALCNALGIDMAAAIGAEMDRVERPEVIERIRKKQATKAGTATALPTPADALTAQEQDRLTEALFRAMRPDAGQHIHGGSESRWATWEEIAPYPAVRESYDNGARAIFALIVAGAAAP